MKLNIIFISLVVALLFSACVPSYIVERKTTTYPDGKVVVEEKPIIKRNYYNGYQPYLYSSYSYPYYSYYGGVSGYRRSQVGSGIIMNSARASSCGTRKSSYRRSSGMVRSGTGRR